MNNGIYTNIGDEMIWFIGTIQDLEDPLYLGRVRVKAFGWHDNYEGPLPWAEVIQPITSAAVSDVGQTPLGMVVGTWCLGFFLDGKNAKRPAVLGTIAGIPVESPFREERKDEPDVNRLARNEEDYPHDILEPKKKTVNEEVEEGKFEGEMGLLEEKVPIALSTSTWDEPATKYEAEYPHNHVFETLSGHIREYDDTEGKERIHEWHKSKSFYEIHPDGTKVDHIVGKSYRIVADDENVKISGKCNLYIDSDCHTYIGGDWKIQVFGDKEEVIMGSLKQTVAEDAEITYAGELTETIGDNATRAINGDGVIAASNRLTLTGGKHVDIGSQSQVTVRSVSSSILLDARTNRVNIDEISRRKVRSF